MVKISIFLLLLSSCSSSGLKKAPDKILRTKQELAKISYHKGTLVLEENALLNKIERFENILKRNKALNTYAWKLHDELLNTYIYFKKRSFKQNKVTIPAHTKIELPFESFCLDPTRAAPSKSEVYRWVKKHPHIPYYSKILKLRLERRISQEESQELFWNLRNKTFWENYPEKLQKILLLIDPNTQKKLPSKAQDQINKAALKILSHTPLGENINQMRDLIDLVKGKYYSYQSLRASIESLTSSYSLSYQNKVEQISGTKLFATHKSFGISFQSITFYNLESTSQEIDLSQYHLRSLRNDIQRMGLLPKIISSKTLKELEKVLFKDMVKAGIGFTPIVGDISDLYEFLVGRDLVTGTLLSKDERLLSGIGIIFGSGNAYRYAKRFIYSSPNYIDDFQKGLSKASKKKTLVSKGPINKLKEQLEVLKKVKYPNLWTKGWPKSDIKNALGHFENHKHEFPEFKNVVEYVEAAHKFLKSPPTGTFRKIRKNGDEVFYHPQTNTFAIKTKTGFPKTMHKPDPKVHGHKTNMEYFNAQ